MTLWCTIRLSCSRFFSFFYNSPFFSTCVVAVLLQMVRYSASFSTAAAAAATHQRTSYSMPEVFRFFVHARTKRQKKKKLCRYHFPTKEKLYKKNNNSCNPKELLIYFPCLKMPLSIIQQNLQIYTDWIQQRSAKSLVCSFFPSSPFRKWINNQQSDQSDFCFHNVDV